MNPNVQSFFDPATWTVTYVVFDQPGSECVIIDSVLDYDPKSGRTKTKSADAVIDFVQKNNLSVSWILETHAHADHVTAAPYLKEKLGGKIGIGKQIQNVQSVFKTIFNLEREFQTDGSQFDHMIEDNEVITAGKLSIKALYVPGHTPACMAYEIGDAIFVGDTLFMPDVGTARCDFPGGSAKTLYQSIQKILSYPDSTRLFMCHDYPPNNRPVTVQCTVADQKANNIHVHNGVSEEEFVKMRTTRDATLDMPTLILPAIQINIRAGNLPPKEDNGISYLKLPLNAL